MFQIDLDHPFDTTSISVLPDSLSTCVARESLDLADLFKTLEQSRRVALLQSNPANYQRIARRAAELPTGEPGPADEPLAVTRAKAGM